MIVGIDLSTRALDLVKLDADTSRAEWVRCELDGSGAWERALYVREALRYEKHALESWWDDVHLVAIEAPYGRGQAGTNALLNRVVGAVCASLPAHLRDPARCWIVAPHEWKAGLGLKGKPTWDDIEGLAPGCVMFDRSPDDFADNTPHEEHARDAFCIALWARGELERGVQEATG